MARLGRRDVRSTGNSRLRPPTVVGEAGGPPPIVDLISYGPGVKLTEPFSGLQRRGSHYRLRPPEVVAAVAEPALAPPVKVYLAKPRARPPATLHLRSPQAVKPADFLPVETSLAPSPAQARKPHSRLGLPQVLNPAERFPGAAVHAARTPQQARFARYKLNPPQVVAVVVTDEVDDRIRVVLASRAPQPRLRDVTSRLRSPAVLYAAVSFGGPRVKLAPPVARVPLAQAGTRPPQVVSQPVAPGFLAEPTRISLATSHRLSRRSRPVLIAPEVILGPEPIVSPIRVVLAAIPERVARIRRAPKPTIIAPEVILAPEPVLAPIRVRLVVTPRPTSSSFLRLPQVVGAFVPPEGPVVPPGVKVTLASRYPNPRHRDVTSKLAAPQAVYVSPRFRGPRVKLTPPVNTVPPVRSFLRDPQVLGAPPAAPDPLVTKLRTTLADQRKRFSASYRLGGPAIIAAQRPQEPIRVELARPRRAPVADSVLRKPRVVSAVAADSLVPPGVRVTLSSRYPNPRHRDTLNRLRPPSVVYVSPVFGGPRVKLAPSVNTVPPVRSVLRKPQVGLAVEPPLVTVLRVTLTEPSRPPLSVARLQPPTVVGQPVLSPPLSVTLAQHPRQARATHPELRPPTAVRDAFRGRPIEVTLVAVAAGVDKQSRRQPVYVLRPVPKILRPPFITRPIKVALQAVKTVVSFVRRKPKPELGRPTDLIPGVPAPEITPVVCDTGTVTDATCDTQTVTDATCDVQTVTDAGSDTATVTDAGTDTGTFTAG